MVDDQDETIPAHNANPRSLVSRGERLPYIDDVVKLIAVASAVLYGILFLAYRSYYVAARINPEDVGVTNSFVLARSFGFIFLTLVASAVVSGYLFVASGFTAGPWTRVDTLRYAILSTLGAALAYYLSAVFPPSISDLPPVLRFVVILFVLLVVAMSLGGLKRSRFAHHWPAAFAIVGLVISVAIPSIAIIEQAAQLGRQARTGQPVTSLEVFAIPIVDISAPRIRLHWANPTIPHPGELFGFDKLPKPAEGVLLGQNDYVVIVSMRVGTQYRVVRLNTPAVVLELL